ncbi:hypothetical protein CSKR_109428 [Clonorchis sinensis]|uniref:Uncharacterized protein n=1 Tax=Clonorchis sinensis TaxID=79923 RepID=A0A3R7D1Y2_CLOSI|nr:hypothetical protein CSKR_109428 [Clonorchis sinensis]
MNLCTVREIPLKPQPLVRWSADNIRFVGARWLKWLQCECTDRKVRDSNPTSASRLPGLGNPAVSHSSCFLLVAWQLGTGKVLQLNFFIR